MKRYKQEKKIEEARRAVKVKVRREERRTGNKRVRYKGRIGETGERR